MTNAVCCSLVLNNIQDGTCWYKHRLVNVSEVKCVPSPAERFFALHCVSKYKLSIPTTAIENVLQCTKMRSRAAFSFFFCLDFFHHTVDNKVRHSAHDSPAIDHWCSWLPKHGVRRGHLSARIHLCPLQQHDDNRISCCELDYELSGLQSAHDTNTDMIQTEPLKVGVCGRHSYTLHKIQTGKMSQCQMSTLKRH